MALMRKRRAIFCALSVLTFATSHFPAPSRATLLSSGATILHGPHQGAQKSTNTGRADRVVKASKARSLATSIGSPGALSSVPHFPQRPLPPSLSYFRRLRWPHFGQVTNTPRSSNCVELIRNLIITTYVSWSPTATEIRQIRDRCSAFGVRKTNTSERDVACRVVGQSGQAPFLCCLVRNSDIMSKG